MKRVLLLIVLCLIFSFPGKANNLTISSVSITNDDIEFDLSWENSWKDAVNHDAVWLFIKFREPNQPWLHATLNTSGHSIPTGALTEQPSDNKGIFVYRDATGAGTNTFNGFSLSWNHSLDGISNTANIQVKVIGIEMVKIPTGPFYVGDGVSTWRLTTYGISKAAYISDQPSIVGTTNYADDNVLKQTGVLVDGDEGIDIDGASAIDNASFPTGYNAFYVMKYEVCQEQYADFLNTLSPAQASNRYTQSSSIYPLTGNNPEIESQAPEHAMTYLSWSDACAYADWAALRPMTEFEFEKSCRGTLFPVAGEFAWGTTNIHASSYSLVNAGANNESISNPGQNTGNALYNLTIGSNISTPLRCGIFSASAINASREETGAGFFGAMELSGNAMERCVNFGSIEGRSFDGSHGDGSLNATGFADQSGWPGYSSGSVSLGYGGGLRGGAFNYFWQTLSVSSRYYANSNNNQRNSSLGFRAVRTAN